MRTGRISVLLGALAFSTTAMAQPLVIADSGDSAWMLAATIFVLIAALPGVALVTGRVKTSGLATLITAATTSLLFATIGYTLAFGDGSDWLGGAGQAMLRNLADLQEGATIPESLYVLFEMALAIFAVGSLAASVACRARAGWLLAFVPMWFLVVYVPVARWTIGGGWLAAAGASDFAGALPAQIAPGFAALIIALLLRRSNDDGAANDPAQSLAGSALLWVGGFGIVGGASFAAGQAAGDALLNLQLGMSASVVTGLAHAYLARRAVTATDAATATLAGLAALMSGADLIAPEGAMIIGAIAGLASALAARFASTLRLGDAANAFASQGTGGIVGALLFPPLVLVTFGGPGFDEGASVGTLMFAQAIATGTVVLWSAFATAVTALMVSMVLPMHAREG